jgi:hypothetical protein
VHDHGARVGRIGLSMLVAARTHQSTGYK